MACFVSYSPVTACRARGLSRVPGSAVPRVPLRPGASPVGRRFGPTRPEQEPELSSQTRHERHPRTLPWRCLSAPQSPGNERLLSAGFASSGDASGLESAFAQGRTVPTDFAASSMTAMTWKGPFSAATLPLHAGMLDAAGTSVMLSAVPAAGPAPAPRAGSADPQPFCPAAFAPLSGRSRRVSSAAGAAAERAARSHRQTCRGLASRLRPRGDPISTSLVAGAGPVA